MMNEFTDPRHDPRHSLRPAQRRAIFPLRPSALELPLEPAAYADEPTPIRAAAVVATLQTRVAEEAEKYVYPNRGEDTTGVPTENPFYPDAERTLPDEVVDAAAQKTIALVPEPPKPRLQSVPIKPSKGKKPKGGGGRKRGPDGRFLPDA